VHDLAVVEAADDLAERLGRAVLAEGLQDGGVDELVDDLLVLAEGSTAESRTSQGRYWTMTGVVEQGVLPASLQLSGPFVVPMPSSPSTFEPQHCTVPPDSRAHAA